MKRLFIPLITLALLSACANDPLNTGTNQTKPFVKTPQSQANTGDAVENQARILIKDRATRAIFDDIVIYRKQKGMQLKRRTAQRLEFSMQIPNVTQATEARMSYIIAPLDGGLQLSARVWQITAPGTTRESVNEITSAVADKIHEELQTYARSKP